MHGDFNVLHPGLLYPVFEFHFRSLEEVLIEIMDVISIRGKTG